MVEYLVGLGIDSISVTPDTLLAVTRQVLEVEQRLGRAAGAAAAKPRPASSGDPSA